MTQRGLVNKERCATDRRGAFVAITKRGRTEIEAAAPGHVGAVRQLFVDQLSGEQLDVIADAAEKVLSGMDRPGAGDMTTSEPPAADHRSRPA